MMRRSVMSDDTTERTRYSCVKPIAQIIGVVAVMGGLLSGCVSSEKFEAEKARALNFQRLLAQEEKRTGEVNVKFQEAQRELTALESQNRDLTSEIDALRDQFNQTQEEVTRLRAGSPAADSADELTLAEPSISEFGLEDIDFKDSDFSDIGDLGDLGGGDAMPTSMASSSGTSHIVAKGETLYRISKQYGVSVGNLKAWNNLSGNIISIGQKLIVSAP